MSQGRPKADSRGRVLWTPSAEFVERANLTAYWSWIEATLGRRFDSYDALWTWSVTDLEDFWRSICDFFSVGEARGNDQVLLGEMEGARWFPDRSVNYAERVLSDHAGTALICASESRATREVSFVELRAAVAGAAAGLRRLGIKPLDRVAGFLPNIPEAVMAFLATASVGAIWSSCSPEFGFTGAVDRLSQIQPSVLVTVDGYTYGGQSYDRLEVIRDIRREIPSIQTVILIPNQPGRIPSDSGFVFWDEFSREDGESVIERVEFNHPLWILFSSGTTGPPKAIVQSHGGIVLEHLKVLSLHLNLSHQDRLFWFTTTGWMMWNLLVSGLLIGSSIVLYDGSPTYPDTEALWRVASACRSTYFGSSASYLASCRQRIGSINKSVDVGSIRTVGSTGSPLSVDTAEWLSDQLSPETMVASISGGTDVCTAFVASCPLLPVRAGEIQCRCLGAYVDVVDEQGQSLVGTAGELILRKPLPSMPLFLWNDEDGSRLGETYFEAIPGVWRHGDWATLTQDGSCIIHGRSDSTLNRGGVRIGTAEIYRIVEEVPGVDDCIVIDVATSDESSELLLFVVPNRSETFDDILELRIRDAIRRELSPRHVPDAVLEIGRLPKTANGKKLEVPLRRLLEGGSIDDSLSLGAIDSLSAVDEVVTVVRDWRQRRG